MIRQAFAEWRGGLVGGKGTITTDSGGLLTMPYTLEGQLRGSPHTKPEELLPALCAASFCMALLAELAAVGVEPRSIHTTATVTMDMRGQCLDPLQLRLEVTAWIPGVDRLHFERASNRAREGWQSPVSFKGRPTITVNVNAW